MTAGDTELFRFCEAELSWQLETIEALVRLESPSDDAAGARSAARSELARRLEALGGRVTGLDDAGARHVRAEIRRGHDRGCCCSATSIPSGRSGRSRS